MDYKIFSKFYNQVYSACDLIEKDFEELEYVNLVNWEQEMQENQYSLMVDKLLNQLDGIKQSKKELQVQQEQEISIKNYYQNEEDVPVEERNKIANQLKEHLKKNQKFLRCRKQLKENKELIFGEKKSQNKNYIYDNSNALKNPESQILENIENNYPSLCETNIPQLQAKYTFTRTDLHQFYVRYKALIQLNAQNTNKGEFKVQNGIDLNTFRLGLIEKFASSHQNFLYTMFKTETLEKMQWLQFLNIVNRVRSKKLADRLTLFFKLMDQDSNGRLSYQEIFLMCQQAMQRFTSENDQNYQNMMSEILVGQTFDLVGYNINEPSKGIPIDLLVKTIMEKKNIFVEEISLILLMCCTENDEIVQQINEQIVGPENNELSELYPQWSRKPGEYEYPKDQLKMDSILLKKFTDDKGAQMQYLLQYYLCRLENEAKLIKNQGQLKKIISTSVKKRKQIEQPKSVFTPELEAKLKALVEQKRKFMQFDDDIMFMMEAKTMKSVRSDVNFIS